MTKSEISKTEFRGGDKFFNQMRDAGIADDDFIKEIVQTFLAESEVTLNELGRAGEEKDVKTLRLKAHKLKSGFLMFDLTEEFQIASELENTENTVNREENDLISKLTFLSKEKFQLLSNKYIHD